MRHHYATVELKEVLPRGTIRVAHADPEGVVIAGAQHDHLRKGPVASEPGDPHLLQTDRGTQPDVSLTILQGMVRFAAAEGHKRTSCGGWNCRLRRGRATFARYRQSSHALSCVTDPQIAGLIDEPECKGFGRQGSARRCVIAGRVEQVQTGWSDLHGPYSTGRVLVERIVSGYRVNMDVRRARTQ